MTRIDKIIGVVTAIIAVNAHGADLSQRIATQSGIVIHLPSEWQQIPNDVLSAHFPTRSQVQLGNEKMVKEETGSYGKKKPRGKD